jgi:hypothetical protein
MLGKVGGMAVELDHVFVVTAVWAPAAERLIALGFTEGAPNMHPGQGTANRRFFFANAMLELIWLHDEREARSDLVAPTRLWERARSRETGASPFGICLRAAAGEALPFPTWSYRPPYLPAGTAIPIAEGTPPTEPMLFANPRGRRPDAEPPERRQPLDHPAGAREIRAARVTLPGAGERSAALQAVERLGVVTFAAGDEHLLELWFDGARQDRSADLRPDLPLALHW